MPELPGQHQGLKGFHGYPSMKVFTTQGFFCYYEHFVKGATSDKKAHRRLPSHRLASAGFF